MTRRYIPLFAVAVLLPAFARGQGTPSPVQITATCTTCPVDVSRILTLGSSGVAPVENRPSRLTRTRRGDLVLTPDQRPYRFQVFDSTGGARGPLARLGPGPGEIQFPRWIDYGDDDTLRVHERGRTLLFGPTLAHVRDLTLTTPLGLAEAGLARLAGGIIAVLSLSGAPGQPRKLEIRRAGGDTVSVSVPNTRGGIVSHRITARASGRDIGVWLLTASADSAGYRIAWVDTAARMTPRFVRRPPWWHHTPEPTIIVYRPRPDGGVTMSRDSADPLPRVATALRDARATRDGRLLVLLSHGREPWGHVTMRNMAWSGVTSAMVEVIDSATATVIGSVRAEGHPIGFADDETFATYREDADGEFWIDLWRIRVTDSARQGSGN